MRARLVGCAIAGWLAIAGVAWAVEAEDFVVKNAEDVIDVCTTAPSDPLHTAAVNFCHGYLVGLYQTLEALQGKGRKPLFCAPSPAPTRNQAIADLVAWGKAHPEYKAENPVNFVVKFITERWPCPA
jgi:hypothetical protein